MRLYCVGITGHRPHKFRSAEVAKKACDDAVAIMKRHYGTDLRFNLGGCIGADQWVGESCIEQAVKYNLFLPFPPEIQGQHWYEEQQAELARQVANCESLSIVGPEYKVQNYHIRDKQIVDNSDFIICFWEGSKNGGTYETIKYALSQSKIVMNGLQDLSTVSSEQLVKRKQYE